MPAITRLDQITGEVANIKWLDPSRKSAQPNPLYILLLSEGFAESDEPRFMAFIKELEREFFKLAPFGYCRSYISFLYCFLPSKTNELSGAPDELDGTWKRVFRLFVQDGKLRPQDEEHILRVVYRLKLPHDLLPPPWLEPNSASIWFEPHSKSYSAIAVIANTNPVDYPDILGATSFRPLIPDEVTGISDHARSVGCVRWFTIGMNGYDVQPGSLYGRFPNLFAHELGHTLGLYDEYEKTTDQYTQPPNDIIGEIMGFSNVQYFAQLSPENVLEQLKWRFLLSSDERAKLRSGDLIYTKEYLVSKGIISSTTTANREIQALDPRTSKPLHWSQAFLVEGAKYRRKVYRPHFECKMRFDTYDERVTENPRRYSLNLRGIETYGSPEFCRVCNYMIRHHLTGYTEFGIGGIHRNRLMLAFYDEIMPRIIESFRIWNDVTGSTLSVARAVCHIASVRSYIIIKNLPEALDVKLNITQEHVSLFYSGIICDPTFCDLYRLASGNEPVTSLDQDGNSDLYYQVSPSESLPFKNWEVNRGFIGTPGEMRAYIYRRRMPRGSYGNPGNDWPDFLHPNAPNNEVDPLIAQVLDLIVLTNYGEKQYPGPDNPEYDNIDRSFGLGNLFLDAMKHEWERWIIYKELKKEGKALPSDRSLDYLIPLDMSISLQAVKNL